MAAENYTNANIAGVVQETALISETINLQSDEFGNIFLEIPGLTNNTQSGELDELLKQFNLKEVKDFLTSKCFKRKILREEILDNPFLFCRS